MLNPDNIPQELQSRPNWVTWKLETRDGKLTKVPYNPQNPQRKAKSNGPETWGTFAQAVEVASTDGFMGIGYMYGNSPHTGIDLDHCRNPETREIQEWAAQIIEVLNSYTEVSPSGEGVHITVEGEVPPGGNVKSEQGPDGKGQIEMYHQSRYLTMTGWHLPGLPLKVLPRQRQLSALHQKIFGQKKPEDQARSTTLDLSDAELIEKAYQAANGAKFQKLWAGDGSDYSTPSHADQALCNLLAFWTNKDFARIERLFFQSGLGRREKWQKRADYRAKTINKAIASTTETYSPPKKKPEADPCTITAACNLTDLGNARRLVAQHGHDLHYSFKAKKWLVWNGRCWEYNFSGEVYRRAKQTIATIYAEAGRADEDSRKKIVAHALRSEHDNRIKGMISQAQSEPGIPVLPEQLDKDPWLLNCLNGTLNLKTGKLKPHDRKDLITRFAPVEYDPKATCPGWEKFLARIQKSNTENIEFIQRILGYSLTGSCREQCLFMLWGTGANGKSTLLGTVSAILGSYAMQTPAETLLAKQRGEIPNDIARLNGPRFVTAIEVSEGKRLAESLVKQLTGQDTVSARFLFGEYFDFRPQFKLFLGTNHKPIIKDTTHAMWRRIKFVSFRVEIPDAEQDPELPEKLKAEGPGILQWMVKGCLSWQKSGLAVPEDVLDATAEYRGEQDVVGNFISDCCIEAPGAMAPAKGLYEAYLDWAKNAGEKWPLTQRAFGMSLSERGFERDKGTGNKGIWRGLGLRE